MEKSSTIMELVSGYDAYSDAEELNFSAASDAPATTPACALSLAFSAIGSHVGSKTIDESC